MNTILLSASVNFSMLLLFSHAAVWLFGTPWSAARQAFLSFTVSWSLLKLMLIESVMPSNHLILYHPLLLPSIFTSIRVFSNGSALCTRWPKYWSFSLSISPSNEFQDWFPLGLTGLISLQSKGLSGVFSNTTLTVFVSLWLLISISIMYSRFIHIAVWISSHSF